MLRYLKTHEWINTESGESGISSYAVEHLGDVVFIELPQIGQLVKKDEGIAVIESHKAASDIYSPVSGKILEVNKDLESSPEKVNENPLIWMYKIEISDVKELNDLMDEKEYKNTLET